MWRVQFKNGRDWDYVLRNNGAKWTGQRDAAIEMVNRMRGGKGVDWVRLQKFRIVEILSI